MGKSAAVDLMALSEGNDKALFLRNILDGLIYDGYRFPTEGSDGVIGPFTISKAMPLFLRKRDEGKWSVELHDKLGLLAAHINFRIVTGQLPKKGAAFQINLRLLHLTVRRRKCQLVIDDNGPSKATADESIHMNRNTQWDGRKENLTNLVRNLETLDRVQFSEEEVVSYLTDYEGLTPAYMARAATGLKEAIEKIIHINSGGGIIVTFDEDKAWSGR
ncbi:hypothetical protein ACFSHT_27410 [Paraburkholderia silviterrae]|uniref:Uncharacterized protein n=1 Tax=Paraburkholderia silviterrae TaxID=2528715 RepID=A0A4R5M091_9BURK|nr:hypothetical protein [Paraburkholderia silviterrae]TDG18330.1 hypothetical protein EYW47_34720 [Paraburkholderia silviterrae]